MHQTWLRRPTSCWCEAVLVRDVFQILANTDLSDPMRQLALEVIVTMSETASAMVRKFSSKFLGEFGK